MKWTLPSVTVYQTLRVIARGKNRPVVGLKLRLDRSRRTKDGTFLDDLVKLGLIEVVERPTPLPSKGYGEPEPEQFRTTYRLTPMGLVAADTGEYERQPPTRERPADKAAAGKKSR